MLGAEVWEWHLPSLNPQVRDKTNIPLAQQVLAYDIDAVVNICCDYQLSRFWAERGGWGVLRVRSSSGGSLNEISVVS